MDQDKWLTGDSTMLASGLSGTPARGQYITRNSRKVFQSLPSEDYADGILFCSDHADAPKLEETPRVNDIYARARAEASNQPLTDKQRIVWDEFVNLTELSSLGGFEGRSVLEAIAKNLNKDHKTIEGHMVAIITKLTGDRPFAERLVKTI